MQQIVNPTQMASALTADVTLPGKQSVKLRLGLSYRGGALQENPKILVMEHLGPNPHSMRLLQRFLEKGRSNGRAWESIQTPVG